MRTLVHFPDKPSRLRSVFLFDDIRLAIQYRERQEKNYIYRVELANNSRILKTDMTFIDLTVGKSVEDIHKLALHFFNGDFIKEKSYEILCEGEVKIVGQIETS